MSDIQSNNNEHLGAKWDALWERLEAGDDMHAVCRDVQGLVKNREYGHSAAIRVLVRILPWLKAHHRPGEKL